MFPVSKEQAREDLEQTIKWAQQGLNVYKNSAILFGINQGAIYIELRLKSLEFILQNSFDGVAIGGLGIGEPIEVSLQITKEVVENIKEELPIYMMGFGRPEDIVELVSLGIDLFDCVLPTRNGRFGRAYTYSGIINLRNNQYADDFTPIDNVCNCFACKNYSKAFLRHLILSNEILGITMVSLHNIHFYTNLFQKMKEAIINNTYLEWKNAFLKKYLQQ
jgi:queuine tRNA-ribosyltransferase